MARGTAPAQLIERIVGGGRDVGRGLEGIGTPTGLDPLGIPGTTRHQTVRGRHEFTIMDAPSTRLGE